MTKWWLIGGIFATLFAAFAGGCGLLFFTMNIPDLMAGHPTYGIEYISVLFGVLPGIIAGLIGWWAFKKHRQQTTED